MALTPPDPSVLITRYPSFKGTDPALIAMLLQEALGFVDETWFPGDQQPALLAYAAHLLAVERMGDQSVTLDDGSVLPTAGPIQSASVGGASFSFSDSALSIQAQQNASTNGLSATPFGRRYLELLRKNKPAVVVATSPVACAGVIPGDFGWHW